MRGFRRRDLIRLVPPLLADTAWAPRHGRANAAEERTDGRVPTEREHYDYIVVGSGAGGGPLAANLALAGYTVLLLEAGGDEDLPEVQVPAFHAISTEHNALRWSFHVRHYADEGRQARDGKYLWEKALGFDGVLYPRAGTLGGCTAHNALILIYPHNRNWDHIADITGDDSWRSERMRCYFERLEDCRYWPEEPGNPSRHGHGGWLTTSFPDLWLLDPDPNLQKIVGATLAQSVWEHGLAGTGLTWRSFLNLLPLSQAWSLLQATSHDWNLSELLRKLKVPDVRTLLPDLNGWEKVSSGYRGIALTPVTVKDGRRIGVRQRIDYARRLAPNHLTVRTHALAARVLLDEENRATGVEYFEGSHLYRADPAAPKDGSAELPRRTVFATREVILAAGAFNTPQLLMLSGIGPLEELKAHGIKVRIKLPGVGCNLQDRYEVGVVSRMKQRFALLEGATFQAPVPGDKGDMPYRAWLDGQGPYTTNGTVVAMVERSSPSQPDPDLYLFGLVGRFEGYRTGYAADSVRSHDHFTWAVLKGSTKNTAGRVRLRSADPRDTPLINFSYFEEGSDAQDEDLDAVVAGVQRVRTIMGRLWVRNLVAEEVVPGPAVDTPEKIREFVRANAWGHHASCTCAIGAENDPLAVLDGKFQVRGAKGLRVVDASAFPRIPGLFIVSAVYMLSEKASDVILEAAGHLQQSGCSAI